MKTSKKLLTISMLAVLGAVSLTGCGGKGKTKTDPSKTVVFWHTFGKENLAMIEEMKKEFLKLPENKGMSIELLNQGGYTDINDKLLKAIAPKNLPTMAICYPDHVADYLRAGVVEELSPYVTASEAASAENENDPYHFNSEEYIASFWQEGKEYDTKGSLYSVPFSKSTEVMFYNKTFFDANQLSVPTTWAEVEETCAKILQIESVKNTKDYDAPLGYDSDDNLFITFCQQLGIPYTSLKEDGTGSFDFNNDQAKEMVQTVKRWYDSKYIKTKGLLGNNTYTSTKFTEQKLHMTIGSTGGTRYNSPSNGAFEVGVAPLPQWSKDEAPACISQGPSIVFFNEGKYASKQQKECAWRFYTYITSAENSAKYAALTGYEPVRSTSYTTSIYEARLAIYKDNVNANTPEAAEIRKSTDYLYSAVANLTETLQSWYFTSPVFVGSATARNQVGAIIPAVCAGENPKSIAEAFNEAMTKCVLAAM